MGECSPAHKSLCIIVLAYIHWLTFRNFHATLHISTISFANQLNYQEHPALIYPPKKLYMSHQSVASVLMKIHHIPVLKQLEELLVAIAVAAREAGFGLNFSSVLFLKFCKNSSHTLSKFANKNSDTSFYSGRHKLSNIGRG